LQKKKRRKKKEKSKEVASFNKAMRKEHIVSVAVSAVAGREKQRTQGVGALQNVASLSL